MYKPTLGELKALVGNPDVYALQTDDGKYVPVREPLTPSVLREHRAGRVTVGTYIVSPPDQARTLVFDIDGPTQEDRDRQLDALMGVIGDLPLDWAIEDSGNKGFHVWIVSPEYMPAETLYRLGRGIRDEAGLPSLEVFPKQTTVRDLGNLVKLPGGIHRKTGRENGIVDGTLDQGNSVAELTELADLYPEVAVRSGGGCESCGVGQQPCVYKIQQGVNEGGRNIHLFHLATMLRKFSLTDENVELVVQRANEASQDGPLPDDEIATILENSKFSGPVCGQLDADVNCGEECILAKHEGLYTRKGGARFAQPGERVVVEVSERTDNGRVLEVTHPDVTQGRMILNEG